MARVIEDYLFIGRPVPTEEGHDATLAETRLPLPTWLTTGKERTVFCLDLPTPPSTNEIWKIKLQYNRSGVAYTGRMVKTDRYNDWITEAGYGASWPQGWEDFKGVVLLYVDCGQMRAGRDCDNTIKPVQDLAATMLGFDDARFHWCAAFRSTDHGIASGRVGVTLILVEA